MRKFFNLAIILAVVLFICSGCATTNLKTSGTSAAELQQLKIDGDIAEAKKWLGIARQRLNNNEDPIRYCRAALVNAHAPLERIETSETELGQLLKDGYVAEAKTWLSHARMRNENNFRNIYFLRQALAKASAPLEKIGTSEEELQQLLKAGYIAEAKMWLGFARERLGDNAQCVRYCREALVKAGASLKEIGTTEKDMRLLLSRNKH